jgi:beta-lysine 5,6-aminomutase alpha subunit
MAYRKLNLDRDKINQCRDSARRIVKPVQKYIDLHSTLAIECSTLCFFGIEHLSDKRPLSDIVITKLDRDRMRRGASYWFGRALVHTKLPPRVLAQKIAEGRQNFESLPDVPFEKIREVTGRLAAEGFKSMEDVVASRKSCTQQFANTPRQSPMLIVSPENTYELKTFLADENADIILFSDIRRFGLHVEEQRKKSCGLKRFGIGISGLESPKHTFYALIAGADLIAKDTMSEMFIHGINSKRALVDAHWVRRMCARFDAIYFSEGNHIRHLDSYRDAHEIIVSQFIEEGFLANATLTPELFAVGHAFDIDPLMDEGFLHELSRAALFRELYPRNPVVYLPPSKFCLDKPISCAELNALFELAASITEQSMVISPIMKDKFEMLKTAALVFKNSRTLGDEIQFNPNGKIARRANTILDNSARMLKKIEFTGLLASFAKGFIADRKIEEQAGSGLEGVFQKDRDYFNPVEELLCRTEKESSCAHAPKPIIKVPAQNVHEKKEEDSRPKPHRYRRRRRFRHERFEQKP